MREPEYEGRYRYESNDPPYHQRRRVHNRPACLVAARIGGFDVEAWRRDGANPSPGACCVGCGELIERL